MAPKGAGDEQRPAAIRQAMWGSSVTWRPESSSLAARQGADGINGGRTGINGGRVYLGPGIRGRRRKKRRVNQNNQPLRPKKQQAENHQGDFRQAQLPPGQPGMQPALPETV